MYQNSLVTIKHALFSEATAQSAFYVKLYRAVIGPSG